MAEQIKVNTQQLKNYSNEIKNGYKNMYQYLSQSKTIVKGLKSSWTGAGANDFYTRFDSIMTKCESTLNIVNTYALTLSETADVYAQNEQKVSDKANKLKIKLK
jgi:WXG100 family type VII secretion target